VTPQAPTNETQEHTPPPAGPGSATWVRYYDRASRRRHRMGGYRKLRAVAKRKRRVERLTMVGIGLSLVALTFVFYLILSR
jgi:hypothetical protein